MSTSSLVSLNSWSEQRLEFTISHIVTVQNEKKHPILRLTETPKNLIKSRLSDLVTGRTWESCSSLIKLPWVCMWQRCCQCETRQYFIPHQRRVWSVPLTLDVKHLEMSSGNNQTHPPPGWFSHSFGHRRVLSSFLKIKTMYTNARSRAFF